MLLARWDAINPPCHTVWKNIFPHPLTKVEGQRRRAQNDHALRRPASRKIASSPSPTLTSGAKQHHHLFQDPQPTHLWLSSYLPCAKPLLSCKRRKGKEALQWTMQQLRKVISDESIFIIRYGDKGPWVGWPKHETRCALPRMMCQLCSLSYGVGIYFCTRSRKFIFSLPKQQSTRMSILKF